ncbi:MAG TPA: hypothetical protein VFF52_29765, partial [Isosphaeraceae bacterium]|nr:hypothetical protein [Isosphaeraceae bacterium]
MALTVTELAEEVRESNKRLTEAIQEMGRKFDDFRVEVSRELREIQGDLRWMKRIGGFLAAIALPALWFSYSAVRRATQIEADALALRADSAQIKSVVVTMQKDSPRIETTLVGSESVPQAWSNRCRVGETHHRK